MKHHTQNPLEDMSLPSVDTEVWCFTHHPDYEVSNFGRVRSWRNNRHGRALIPRILAPGLSRGYPYVAFGRAKRFAVHRLVAAAFIGPCPTGQEVMHRDDNRLNAYECNLLYGTRRENLLDCYRKGRR